MISEEEVYPYQRPPLSKGALWSPIDKVDENNIIYSNRNYRDNLFYGDDTSKFFGESGPVLLNTKALALSATKHYIKLSNQKFIRYGKCLIATGSKPKQLSIPHPQESNKITTYRTIKDLENLVEFVEQDQPKHITIIGAGLLGTELAGGLVKRASNTNTEVAHVYPEEGVLSKLLPKYLSQYLTNFLSDSGLKVFNEKDAKEIIEDPTNGKLIIRFHDGQELVTDRVVVAIGASPNIDIAKESKLEIDGNNGGIVVNSELMIRSDLYAAGDVASIWNPIEKRYRHEHHWHALETGKVAGINMAGGKEPYFMWPVYKIQVIGKEYMAIGEVNSTLENVGVWLKGPEAEGNGTVKDSSYQQSGEYEKGAVYYLRDKKIVGVLLTSQLEEKFEDAFRVLELPREYENIQDLVRAIQWEKPEENNDNINNKENKH
eukprot:TRINITY_DN6439_c0_g2_i2.p1 TRINITY_DN6439_c0_g2~~TRINITY_DN6439_c0_g2_i2.p1  ORF type:complete len:432 (-),score=117.73 TRINITY_DN6439_c0_g2_i2:42-1337(-)